MYEHLERETAPSTHVTAFASLAGTWRSLLAKLRSTPIVVLRYEEIPPLFERAMLSSLTEVAGDKNGQFNRISFDISESSNMASTLFVVPSYEPISVAETLLCITRHLVESGGEARFVVVTSAERLAQFRQHACFPLVESYVETYEEISQDPLSFLTQFTGLSGLPPYSERNLWRLIFYGAVTALEQAVLDEEQLQVVVSGLKLIAAGESRRAFYEWRELPPRSKLASLYFDSLKFSDVDRNLSRTDELFYLAKCFRTFCEFGVTSAVQGIMATSQASEQFQLMTRLREQEAFSQYLSEGLQFWQMLAFKYLLGEYQPPTHSIGSLDELVHNNPNLRRAVEKVGEMLGSASPFDSRWSSVEAAQTAFEYVYAIVASQQQLDVLALEDLIGSFLTDYERWLGERAYGETQLVQLVHKTVNIAMFTCACLSLHNQPLSGRGFGLFQKLLSRSFSELGSSFTVSDEQRENLQWNLHVLGLFEPRFHEIARQIFLRAEVIKAVEEKAEQILRSDTPVEGFFEFFASQLREYDYFLDLRKWRLLASPLAKSYSELNERVLQAMPPYSLEYQSSHCICGLISDAQLAAEYDRVYVLIVDSLSYLEWKLIKQHFEDLGEDIHVLEQYAFAPIPTYTPANTTCLITGFTPSEIGVCDWSIKPLGQGIVDLKDDAAKQVINGITLSPRHSVTLVHNQVGSNLTRLWRTLADVEEVAIPSAQSLKAITQVRNQIYQLDPTHKVVAVYIADFDEAGHWHLSMDGWHEYHSLLARRIRENLLQPVFSRARKQGERTLAILTADHGKLSRYESKLLELTVPSSDAFDGCASILDRYEIGKSSRHIVAWIPDSEIDEVQCAIQKAVDNQMDVTAYVGKAVSRFFPHTSKTSLLNPNVVILSRLGLGGVMGHGGGSLSEVVVPAVRFSWG